jgi:hypothetical protein
LSGLLIDTHYSPPSPPPPPPPPLPLSSLSFAIIPSFSTAPHLAHCHWVLARVNLKGFFSVLYFFKQSTLVYNVKYNTGIRLIAALCILCVGQFSGGSRIRPININYLNNILQCKFLASHFYRSKR